MSPTIETPAAPPRLTPEELAELVQRERTKGNPWAIFAGSWVDPNDPEDKAFWAAILEHRRQTELQLEAMAELEDREQPS